MVVVMGQKRPLGRPVERDKLEGRGKAGSRVVGSYCLFFFFEIFAFILQNFLDIFILLLLFVFVLKKNHQISCFFKKERGKKKAKCRAKFSFYYYF